MSNEAIIYSGGIYNLILIVFHLLFWKLFDWRKDLSSLSHINRAIMQVLNLSLTFVFLIFAYVSFFHHSELLITKLGRSLLILMAIFWLLRAIEQIVFFGFRSHISKAFFMFFMLGAVIYTLPLFRIGNS